MAIDLNHIIVAANDAEASARWLADLFGTEPPTRFGHFWQFKTANGVALDFASVPEGAEIASTHYAFLVSDDDFTRIYGEIVDRNMDHWADPQARVPGEINRNDGGRGVYFRSEDGHFLEIITVPYGGWD